MNSADCETLRNQVRKIPLSGKNRLNALAIWDLASTIRKIFGQEENRWATCLKPKGQPEIQNESSLAWTGGTLKHADKSEHAKPSLLQRHCVTLFLEESLRGKTHLHTRIPEDLQKELFQDPELIHQMAYSFPEIVLKHLPETLHEAIRKPGHPLEKTLELLAQTQPELLLGARAEAKKDLRSKSSPTHHTNWEKKLEDGADATKTTETEILFLFGHDLLNAMAFDKLLQRHQLFTFIHPTSDPASPLNPRLPAHCPNNPVFIQNIFERLNDYQKNRILQGQAAYAAAGFNTIRKFLNREQYLGVLEMETGMLLEKFSEANEDQSLHAELHGHNDPETAAILTAQLECPQRYGFPYPQSRKTLEKILQNKKIPEPVRNAAATAVVRAI
jgi:hypothetical protein